MCLCKSIFKFEFLNYIFIAFQEITYTLLEYMYIYFYHLVGIHTNPEE